MEPYRKVVGGLLCSRVSRILVTVALVQVFALWLSISAFAQGDRRVETGSAAGRIVVEVDPRVELISIVFRLAGNPEYNDGTLRPYVKAIEKHFGDFDNHPAVKMAAELRRTRSMSCDGPMSLAINIDRNLQPIKGFDQWPWGIDDRWQEEETIEFLERLRAFAKETKFDEFFKAQSEIYQSGIRSCEDLIGPLNIGQWFADFFGVTDYGDMKLVLGFVNGFSNYGPTSVAGDKKEIYAIVGMRPFDQANTVMFRPSQIGTTVHEFCHSFINPVVKTHLAQMQPAGEKLSTTHESTMRMGGYQRSDSVLYETAVRACVMCFVQAKFEPIYLEYFLRDEVRAGFVWIEDSGNFLKTYQDNRDKYPTFEAFFPEFITFLNDYTAQD